MKKVILIFSLFIINLYSYSQQKTVDLLKGEIAAYHCTYSKLIDLDKHDTIYYLYMGFQNEKYTAITDIKSLYFEKQNELEEFIVDLKSALAEMDNKTSKVSWRRKKYSINKYDFSTDLYIENKDGAYATINKKKSNKINRLA